MSPWLVGEDQLPHLELTRQIVRKFKHIYKKEIFPEPEALLTQDKRLLGLDGRKMSKSYNNYIALSEEPESIRKKVQNMFTDPARVKITDPGHPEKCNVHNYYAVFAPLRKQEIDERCRKAQIGCTECKKELSSLLIKFLEPIQEKRNKLIENKEEILHILDAGEKKAQAVASSTMEEVKKLLNI